MKEKIAISIIREEITVSWSEISSKCYYIKNNKWIGDAIRLLNHLCWDK